MMVLVMLWRLEVGGWRVSYSELETLEQLIVRWQVSSGDNRLLVQC